MNTLQYFQENDSLTEAGYTFGQSMSDFVDEATMADYTCDDGDVMQEAVDAFWAHANTIPEKMRDRLGERNCRTVREIILTLFNPKAYIDRYDRERLTKALAEVLRKDELVEAFDEWGVACNEFFRLKWLVAEHGGWKKD